MATEISQIVFEEHSPGRNRTIWLRHVDPVGDAELIHRWMHQPHVEPFWAMAWPLDEVRAYLERNAAEPTRSAYVGYVDADAVGYLETYDPAHDVLGSHYAVQPGDLGAHMLIGNKDYLGRYSVTLGRAGTRFLFSQPGVRRIVGEPDVRNHNVLTLLTFLGYRKQGEVDLPDKRAALVVCELDTFNRLTRRRRAT